MECLNRSLVETREARRLACQKWRKNHPEIKKAQSKEWRKNNPVKALIHGAKRRAKMRGLDFDLSEADLMPLPTHCPVLGLELRYWTPREGKSGRKNPNAASLDRKDNTQGYIRRNVTVMSLRANQLKSDGRLAEFEALVTWIRGNPTFRMSK